MWIEYAGEIDAGKLKRAPPSDPDALPDLAEVPEGIPYLGETPRTPGAGAAEDLAQEQQAKELADGESPRTRAALRFAVATAGAVVIVLLVASFLRRSSTPEDEEEKPIEDAAAEAAAVAAGALSGLDETVPSGRVVAEYIRLQQALERTRSHRLPHQTPLEHARAVAGRREVDEAFFDLHRVLYRLLYGGEPIDWRHADAVVKSCKLRRALGSRRSARSRRRSIPDRIGAAAAIRPGRDAGGCEWRRRSRPCHRRRLRVGHAGRSAAEEVAEEKHPSNRPWHLRSRCCG